MGRVFRRALPGAVLAGRFGAILGLVPWLPVLMGAEALDNWEARVSPYGTDNGWRGVAFGNGQFVAVSGSGGLVATSPDGVGWSPHSVGASKALYDVAFGGGRFVAAGNGGAVFTSTNGSDWQPQDSDTNAHLYGIAYDGQKFVAVGGGGTILTSTNGTSWTPKNTENTTQWRAVGFGDGSTVVVGYRTESPFSYTRSAASTNLNNWEFRDTGPLFYLSGLTFGGGKFVACGYGGTIQSSVNGIEWTPGINPVNSWLNAVAFGDGTYVAVGESGAVISSPDGANWKIRRSALGSVLESVAFGIDSWIAVGGNGLILHSPAGGGGPSPSELAITDPRRVGNRFTFLFNGVVGEAYSVQVSGNLKTWQEATQVTSQAIPTSVSLNGQNQRSRFYRVLPAAAL